MDLGEKLRFLREQKHWTLADVSAGTGISISHLSAMEKGTRPNPSFFVVAKLAQYYDVPLSHFLEEGNSSYLPSKQEQPHASERSAIYEEIAKQMADEQTLDDPSKLLELIARYLKKRPLEEDKT